MWGDLLRHGRLQSVGCCRIAQVLQVCNTAEGLTALSLNYALRVAWKTEWLVVQAEGVRKIPAIEFLRDIESAPRTQLLQILEAVKCVGPHRWRDTHSHDKMEGELDDLHEVRDRHGETLYRLYLKWVLDASTVWVLDGRTKPNGTKLPTVEYEKFGR